MSEIRIQKYLSDCGILSRRRAEEEIKAGRITVNGNKAMIGQKIDAASDAVMYNGKLIEQRGVKLYYKLNKPRGYVTTLSDEKGRKCIADLLSGIPQRLYPIGRLDLNSEGLVLLTNDGAVANRTMHPKSGVEKIYYVKVSGKPEPQTMKRLNQSMEIDGYRTVPCEVTVVEEGENTLLKFVLREGRNRQIRKMCEQCQVNVLRLKRVAVGKIALGDLPSGQLKPLNRKEMDYLKSL